MRRVSQLVMLALAAAGAAAAPCPEHDRGTLEEWRCFGEVEFASRIEGEDEFGARFVLFSNGERLYEKREAPSAKGRWPARTGGSTAASSAKTPPSSGAMTRSCSSSSSS